MLGLAVQRGALAGAAAHELSCLDELYQEESWGRDEAAANRRARLARDIAEAEALLRLCAEPP